MSVEQRSSDVEADDATGITCRGCGAAVLETVAETEHADGSVHVDVSCPACFAGGRQIVNPAGPRAIREVGAALDGQRVMADGGVSGDDTGQIGSRMTLGPALVHDIEELEDGTVKIELTPKGDEYLKSIVWRQLQPDTSRTGGDQA